MTTRITLSHRLLLAGITMLGAICIFIALQAVGAISAAYADTGATGSGTTSQIVVTQATPTQDPVVIASQVTDSGWDLISSYGWIWAGMLLLVGLGQAFLKRQHWLAQGRLLASITGIVAVLGAVLDWKFHGAPSSGIAVTLFTAISLVWHPTIPGAVPPAPPTKPDATSLRVAQSGRVSVAMVLLISIFGAAALGIFGMTGCDDVKSAGKAVIDCTKTNYQVAAVELAKCTTWSCVYETAIGFGATVGGCAFRALVDSGTQLAGSQRSAKPVDGTAEFERFRASIAGGSTYRTAAGDR